MNDNTQQTTTSVILRQYDESQTISEEFRDSVHRLIKDLLSTTNKNVHSVSSRVKDRSHLESKIQRLNYQQLADITDVIGVRIITYFENEVDEIGKLIESEFQVDRRHSIDKRESLDPDRFGYLSLHYVCGFNAKRSRLRENTRFKGKKVEIQIRSILQHAWAEIEHDLGYKAGAVIPKPIRRRFSRLAGLLEIADLEFSRLRVDLEDYGREVDKAIEEDNSTSPNTSQIELDQVSVARFLIIDPLVHKYDRQIADAWGPGVPLNPEISLSGGLEQNLRDVQIRNLAQLRSAMKKHGPRLKHQVQLMTRGENHRRGDLPRGISVFQLFLFLLAQQAAGDKKEMVILLNRHRIERDGSREKLASALLKAQSAPSRVAHQ